MGARSATGPGAATGPHPGAGSGQAGVSGDAAIPGVPHAVSTPAGHAHARRPISRLAARSPGRQPQAARARGPTRPAGRFRQRSGRYRRPAASSRAGQSACECQPQLRVPAAPHDSGRRRGHGRTGRRRDHSGPSARRSRGPCGRRSLRWCADPTRYRRGGHGRAGREQHSRCAAGRGDRNSAPGGATTGPRRRTGPLRKGTRAGGAFRHPPAAPEGQAVSSGRPGPGHAVNSPGNPAAGPAGGAAAPGRGADRPASPAAAPGVAAARGGSAQPVTGRAPAARAGRSAGSGPAPASPAAPASPPAPAGPPAPARPPAPPANRHPASASPVPAAANPVPGRGEHARTGRRGHSRPGSRRPGHGAGRSGRAHGTCQRWTGRGRGRSRRHVPSTRPVARQRPRSPRQRRCHADRVPRAHAAVGARGVRHLRQGASCPRRAVVPRRGQPHRHPLGDPGGV